MKYGLPYKGSKNKLAKRILALMPRAEHFIDLFCGGCAVSHCALTMGKYPHVHVNDADWRPVTLFMDVLQGRYADEDRWISREDFARLKDKDPYVAVVWSFGNNMRDYLYSRDIEPLKRAIHYAIFYSDYAPGKELGHDLSFIDCIPSLDRRYIAVKRYFSQFGHFQQQSFEGGGIKQCGCSTSNVGTGWMLASKKKESAKSCNFSPGSTSTICHTDGWVYRLQYRERHASLPLYGGGRSVSLTSSVGDYADVEIPRGSVVYCDIPYRETNVYDKENDFNYQRFYEWCARQTEPVFISSYDMPAEGFRCIAEFEHRSILCATRNNAVTERIFMPIHQEPPKRPVQLELF